MKHRTRTTVPAGNAENDLTGLAVTAYHEVVQSPEWSDVPYMVICDSCGRMVLRNCGRWWEVP